jgi:hypothetical protein
MFIQTFTVDFNFITNALERLQNSIYFEDNSDDNFGIIMKSSTRYPQKNAISSIKFNRAAAIRTKEPSRLNICTVRAAFCLPTSASSYTSRHAAINLSELCETSTIRNLK